MKMLNIENLTGAFNKFRMENQLKQFTSQEILGALKAMGFNKTIAWAIMSHYMEWEQIGTSKLYALMKTPLHKNQIEALYKNHRKKVNEYRKSSKEKTTSTFEEEKAIEFLLKKGYQIRRVKGFDLERFAKENSELYRKYLIYEMV